MKTILIALLLCGHALAALSANTVFEVRATGSDANGGCYVTGSSGTDYSQQDAAQVAFTDLVIGVTTTQLTSVANPFTSAYVGDCVQVTGGTGFTAGVYYVVSVATGTATMDRSVGTTASTGGTGNLGGAMLSPAIPCAFAPVIGNTVYLKAGTYSMTSTTSNVASGAIGCAVAMYFVGYTSSRTLLNHDSRPTIQCNVASCQPVKGNTPGFLNIIFDGNAQTSSLLTGNNNFFQDVLIENFRAAVGGNSTFVRAEIVGCSAQCANNAVYFSVAHGNTATPINAITLVGSISYGNTGATTDGATVTVAAFGNTFYGNGRNGMLLNGNTTKSTANNIFVSNTNVGVNCQSQFGNLVDTNGFFSNTAGQTTGCTSAGSLVTNSISLAGDPFTASGSSDFSLNSSAGAVLKGVALPLSFPGGLTANFGDIGAAQAQATGGGGGQVGYAQ